MNKIVRKHYPVANLPQDLQDELVGLRTVRVVIEEEQDPSEGPTGEDFRQVHLRIMNEIEPMTFKQLLADRLAHPDKYRRQVTPDEAAARIRELRDEWDDRR